MADRERLAYYASPAGRTYIQGFRALVDELPSDVAELAATVRGLVSNPSPSTRQQLPPERRAEDRHQTAEGVLNRVLELDDRPLTEPRPRELRLAGNCYHAALLLTSFLRSRAQPARARCGFGSYLADGWWIHHWVVEHWNGETWQLIDPDVGKDTLDPQSFRNGLTAWTACRDDRAEDVSRYGLGTDQRGWSELRGSALCDLAALNKSEIFFWDGWTLASPDEAPRPEDHAIDKLVAISGDDMSLHRLRQGFDANPDLRP